MIRTCSMPRLPLPQWSPPLTRKRGPERSDPCHSSGEVWELPLLIGWRIIPARRARKPSEKSA
jgi:hypothetical protein